jgi:hypothetical protein
MNSPVFYQKFNILFLCDFFCKVVRGDLMMDEWGAVIVHREIGTPPKKRHLLVPVFPYLSVQFFSVG